MKIIRMETYLVQIPLKPERMMISSLGRTVESKYLLLRIWTDEGIEGVGEATVSPAWSGETVWGVKSLIERLLAPPLIGCDPRDVVEIDRVMDGICRHNWFAKSAIEMACWDIRGQAAGKPVYELLGGAKRPLSIRSRFSMGAYEPTRAAQRAKELVTEGFTTIKVKVGTDPRQDVQRVHAVREAIGPDVDLVIDANCGWDADTAIRSIGEMAECRLSLVEQPTPNGDYAAMARVRRQIDPPIMADDICFDLVHAQELIHNECCDVISVYPGEKRRHSQIATNRPTGRGAWSGMLDRFESGMGRCHRCNGASGRVTTEYEGREISRRYLGTRLSPVLDCQKPDRDRRSDDDHHRSAGIGHRGGLGRH